MLGIQQKDKSRRSILKNQQTTSDCWLKHLGKFWIDRFLPSEPFTKLLESTRSTYKHFYYRLIIHQTITLRIVKMMYLFRYTLLIKLLPQFRDFSQCILVVD